MWLSRTVTSLALAILLFGCAEREAEVSGKAPDVYPPDKVTDFVAFAYADRVEMSWQNPDNEDFLGVLLIRSESNVIDFPVWGRSYEAGEVLGDGLVIYVDDGEEFKDYDINCGKTYKYFLFTFDKSHNYSAPAKLEAVPGGMIVGRLGFAVTKLADGRFLITGGIAYGGPTNTAEIFDPATGEFQLLPYRMSTARFSHSATLLADGRVLIVGGFKEGLSETLSTAEIFDPQSGRFRRLSSGLEFARAEHKAELLPDGKVLIVGGTDGMAPIASAEIFDPQTEEFEELPSELADARMSFSMTPFIKDSVQYFLIAGGVGTDGFALDTAEIFDTSDLRFENLSGEEGKTEKMLCARAVHKAVALDESRVLIVGGYTGDEVAGAPTSCVEIFDPLSTEPFLSAADLLQARSGFAVSTLSDGRVLVVGGTGAFLEIIATAELYDPALDNWTPAGTLIVPRTVAQLINVGDEHLLLIGGNASGNFFAPRPTSTPELFDPDTLSFSLYVSCSK